MNEISSFQNVLNYGTLTQKQSVLDAIVKDFNPIYAPIIQNALNAPENLVRIQAAAIVAKISIDFESEIASLKKEVEDEPDNLENLMDLAKGYDEFAGLGILPSIRLKEVSRDATKLYKKYLEKNPEDKSVWFSIGRLMFYSKDYEDFLWWLEEYRKKFQDFSEVLHKWELETLYKLKRFDKFNSLLASRR